ncbi:MAG: SPOR domain-containing protein, partial [Thermodesulfobacteriota bacterium]
MSHRNFRKPVQIRFNGALIAIFLLILAVGMMSCAGRRVGHRPAEPKSPAKALSRMGYAVQVGAFSDVENAARLTESLRRQGLDATYFVARAGLYKVRFGNFP